jgi:hypothetical protein
MEQDPIGFKGGNNDLYGYEHDRPVSLLDPNGLDVGLDPYGYPNWYFGYSAVVQGYVDLGTILNAGGGGTWAQPYYAGSGEFTITQAPNAPSSGNVQSISSSVTIQGISSPSGSCNTVVGLSGAVLHAGTIHMSLNCAPSVWGSTFDVSFTIASIGSVTPAAISAVVF